MNHKTELDHNFIPPDNEDVVRYHNEMILLTGIFSIPVIGVGLFLSAIICEWAWHKIRIGRLMLLIFWHKIVTFKY